VRTFVYTAKDAKSDRKIEAELQADDENAAVKQLTDRGLVPISVKAKARQFKLPFIGDKISVKEKIIFSRQLSTLSNAGVPLVTSLHTVADQTSDAKFKDIIINVTSAVESGSTFAEALAAHPDVFDEIYVALVAAGETSGTLDQSLERLATQQEKDAEVISAVRGAMVYPLIVLLVLAAVGTFMMVTVLPQVQSLYNSIPGAKLPLITTVMMAFSNLLIHFWWLAIILLIATIFFGRRWAKTPPGIATLDTIKLKAPLIGALYNKLYMARFSRISATLVAAGVPLIRVLETAARAVGNSHVSNSIMRASDQVKGGKSLSESITGDPNFTELVPNMIRTGEQSGSLDTMLARVADYYEKEIAAQIKTISTIVEPAMMIIVGVIALIVVAAVLLPIYSLAGKTGNGAGF